MKKEREYRTYFHIAQSWGVHESTIAWSAELRSAAFPKGSRKPPGSAAPSQRHSLETVQTFGLGRTKFVAEGNRRIVHRVEDQLIQSRKFSLPGKKLLSSTETEWSVMPTHSRYVPKAREAFASPVLQSKTMARMRRPTFDSRS